MKRALTLLLGAFLSCAFFSAAVVAQELSEPEKNFERLWQAFDRNYAIFGPKRIDWDALYKVYRPRITPKTTDDELFDIMANLLGHLNDNHVRLTSPTRRFQSGILGEMKMEDFSLDLVKQKYLRGKFKALADGIFHYGWLSDTIGYFHFRNFGQYELSEAAIDEIIREFKDARGIVIDVRGNGGGDDRVGKLIADRFADRTRHYMTTRIRNGPRHDDFTAPKYWQVEADGPLQFTKPVILLTHRFSVSAAENFALAMRVLPHVTIVGDATSGVFADVYGDKLPNGWQVRISYKLFEDQNGFCWEGIGVPADIRQTNTKENIEQKTDKVIELAMSLLSRDALKPKSELSGLTAPRESLAKTLARTLHEKRIEAALRSFNKSKAGKPESYYVDEEELEEVGNKLWNERLRREAIEVFKLNVREFPKSSSGHERLGRAYLENGMAVLGRASYEKSIETNRQSYPWEIRSYGEAKKVLSGEKVIGQTPVSIDPKILATLTGQYQADFGTIAVMQEGDRLFLLPTGEAKQELLPQSETGFVVVTATGERGPRVEFVRDEKGLTTQLNIQAGRQIQARKIR